MFWLRDRFFKFFFFFSISNFVAAPQQVDTQRVGEEQVSFRDVEKKGKKGGSNKPYPPPATFLNNNTQPSSFQSRDFVTSANRWRRAGNLSLPCTSSLHLSRPFFPPFFLGRCHTHNFFFLHLLYVQVTCVLCMRMLSTLLRALRDPCHRLRSPLLGNRKLGRMIKI